VLFDEVFWRSLRYLTAGGSAPQLRGYLDQGRDVILEALDKQRLEIEGKEPLARLAETVCRDTLLSKMLGEVLDSVGPYGRIDIRTGQGRGVEREYVESMSWEGGLLSREMITNRKTLAAELEDASILISDLAVEDARDLIPMLNRLRSAGVHELLLLVNKLPDGALGLLRAAGQGEAPLRVVAVKPPGTSAEKTAIALTDIAMLTGGQPVLQVAGESLASVEPARLGWARKVWADAHHFGIAGGRGDPRLLHRHLAGLRAAHAAASGSDRETIQARIGSLSGGSAILWVGGASNSEIEVRKETAARAIRALREASLYGVVPGGGAALLACRPAVRATLKRVSNDDERAAYRVLLAGLEAPFRALVANAGFDPARAQASVEAAGPGHAFDAVSGAVVNVSEAGLYDVAGVLRGAVHRAVSSAGLALTVDVLVQHRRPEESMAP
jgi:chaperonin GroEL